MKVKFKYLFYICNIILIQVMAFADGTENNNLKTDNASEIAAFIPLTLIERGFNNVGNLDIKQLAIDIQTKVKWSAFPNYSIGAGKYGSTRTGSSCHYSKSGVLVNLPHLENLKKDKFLIAGLLLHEALCVLGLVDDSYAISGVLGLIHLMTENKSEEVIQKIHSLIDSDKFKVVFNLFLIKRLEDQKYSIISEHTQIAYNENTNDINKTESGILDPIINFVEDILKFIKDFFNFFGDLFTLELAQNNREGEPVRLALGEGGTVTGIGGGGDGRSWFFKVLLLKNFVQIYHICEKLPASDFVPYPGQDPSKLDGLELKISCKYPQISDWWYYILNVNIETGSFNYPFLQPVEIPQQMSWMGSYAIEKIKSSNTFFDFDVNITIDVMRWLTQDYQEWDGFATGVSIVLIKSYFPGANDVFQFKGPEAVINILSKVFENSDVKHCNESITKSIESGSDLKDTYSYVHVPVEKYFLKLAQIKSEERDSEPYCAIWRR